MFKFSSLFFLFFVACGSSNTTVINNYLQPDASVPAFGGSSSTGGSSNGSQTGGTSSSATGGQGNLSTGGSSSVLQGTGGNSTSPSNLAGASGGAPALVTGPACGTSDASDPINASGGCTPQPLTIPQASLKGPYDSHALCIGDRQYYLQVNEWGSTAAQSLLYGGGDYYFRITEQNGTSSSGAPTGFPSMFIGANSGHTTAGSNMPKLVSSLTSVPTTWNWKDNGAVDGVTDAGTNTYNATYDVWFSTNPAGEPGTSCPSGGFLMVWLHKPAAAEPIGTGGRATYSGVTVAGIPGTWDVWVGPNQGCSSVPCISFVRTDINPAYSMSFDLNLFIKDAVTNRPDTIKDTMYLTNIFAGFEIWSGGVGLETTSFCADVN